MVDKKIYKSTYESQKDQYTQQLDRLKDEYYKISDSNKKVDLLYQDIFGKNKYKWEDLILLVIEESGNPYSYNMLDELIALMREKDSQELSHIFENIRFIEYIVDISLDFDVLSIVLRENSLWAKNTTEQQYLLKKIGNKINEKIKILQEQKQLDIKFQTKTFQEAIKFMYCEKESKQQNFSFEKYKNKIISITQFIIVPLSQYMQDFHELTYILVKYMCIIDSQTQDDLQILNKMANSILQDLDDKEFKQFLSLPYVKQQEEILTQDKLQLIKPVSNYIGLHNLGNTCYMNSFMQCLFMTDKFRQFVMLYQQKQNPKAFLEDEEDSFKMLIKLFYNQIYSQEVIYPQQLKNSLPFPFKDSMEQQDAGEFGRIYLEYLENILKEGDSKNNNKIEQLFFGQVTNKIKCETCLNTVELKEKIMDMLVNFSKDTWSEVTKSHSLIKMIKNYFSTELFMEDNQYFCDKCDKLTQKATKQIILNTLPPYLIITINRFVYDIKEMKQYKLKEKVDIPFEFDLKEVFPELKIQENSGCKYKLYGFIVHLGKSADSGHYISYCREIDNQQSLDWIMFDDSMVSQQPARRYQDFEKNWSEWETAYILFYSNDSQMPMNLQEYTRRTSLIRSGLRVSRDGNFGNSGNAGFYQSSIR